MSQRESTLVRCCVMKEMLATDRGDSLRRIISTDVTTAPIVVAIDSVDDGIQGQCVLIGPSDSQIGPTESRNWSLPRRYPFLRRAQRRR